MRCSHPGADLSIAAAWLAPLLFGFQIYFDFSGYVDMALGMSKLFGLELMPNFSTPFISHTPSEFWSRWNITLSRWFGDTSTSRSAARAVRSR